MEITEKLKGMLEDPFDGLKENNEFKDKCKEIAKELFCNHCINCNGTKYYFAEIEFYYYDSERYLQNREQYKWQEVTYPRTCAAGALFYHLSGMDVCFISNLPKDFKKKKEVFGGGILIRSIWEKDDKDNQIITVGPLTCVNKILNACNGKQMPELKKISPLEQIDITPAETYRYLGKKDFDSIAKQKNRDGNLELAFYDSNIQEKDWKHARSSYYSNRLKPDFTKERK